MVCTCVSIGMVTVSPVGGVLLCSGAAKLAVPRHTARAVGELLPALARHARRLVVALAVPSVRPAAGVALTVLGLGFAMAGGYGRLRRSRAACGCFGHAGGRPLGAGTVAAGLALAAVGVLAVLATGTPGGAAVGLALLAGLTVLLTAWLHRALIRDLVRPRDTAAVGKGASA